MSQHIDYATCPACGNEKAEAVYDEEVMSGFCCDRCHLRGVANHDECSEPGPWISTKDEFPSEDGLYLAKIKKDGQIVQTVIYYWADDAGNYMDECDHKGNRTPTVIEALVEWAERPDECNDQG